MLRNACAIFSLSALLAASCTTGSNTARDPKTLRIASSQEFSNLDPRKARSLASMNLMHLMYEGLYRSTNGMSSNPGVAQEVTISEDGKTYQFFLRPCHWSDGIPVTSIDFLESWKAMLDPKFAAPNAYQFFIIQNAQEVYEGTKSISELGVETPDERTLIVHLQEPTPAFLQMVATPPFFPMPHHRAVSQKGERPIVNGPYILESWRPLYDMTLMKNAHYWAISSSLPNKIIASIFDENTALSLFEKGEIDWIGSPLFFLPSDAMSHLKKHKRFKKIDCAGTHFIRVNTKKTPLDDIAIRQSLSKAIERNDLTQHILQGGQRPAMTFLPPIFGRMKRPLKFTHLLPPEQIKQKVTKLTLMYAANDHTTKIAQLIQDNWHKTLGIQVKLQPTDSQNFYHRINKGDYELALGSWYADFLDPNNFLSVFEKANNGTNNTGWENAEYQKLLHQARLEKNDKKRKTLYLKADRLLSLESPIIPLYHAAFNFMTTPEYSGCTLSPLGIISFED